jgi:alpha-glucoside transport system substrate-binding protein
MEERKRMKRNKLVLTLFMVLAFGLSACGDTATPVPPTATTTAQQPTATTMAEQPTVMAENPTATTEAMEAPTATTAAMAEPTATLVTTGQAGDKTVTVLSLWGGAEQEAFQKVLDGFTAKTGINVQYEQARDFLPALRTRLAAGNPPAVAIIPRPGVMTDLATEGSLKSFADLGISEEAIDNSYSQAWKDLGTANGKIYGAAVKANSKSTIWYNPESFTTLGVETPKTWQELIDISDKYVAAGKTPWSVGGGDSWTLTDWFENIYVREAGPDKYSELFGGKLPFTDPTVIKSLQTMATIVANEDYVAGGREGVLGTKFVDGIGRVFGENADAQMYFEGGFVGAIALQDVNPKLTAGKDIAFFPFPTIDEQYDSPLIGAGDLMSAFVDTPEVREFMNYMITKEAGEIWAKTGAIVSPNKLVDASVYPNELAQAEAAQVASATVFRFDGSDLLPGTLGEEWGTALQGVVENPDDIQSLMEDFEAKAGQEFNR